MKIQYERIALRTKAVDIITKANAIIDEYEAQGFTLTLRQLYYQFVARGLLENKFRNYKMLGEVISSGRRAGLVSWEAIVDRTRFLRTQASWETPAEIIDSCARQFKVDPWKLQRNYVEVWFEKDALMGVFERAAQTCRLPFFSCRGYTSDSEIWGAAQRLARRRREGKRTVVLHFGDHDPSGIDMTRDIESRLALFGAPDVLVKRMALNMDQVEQYNPPPNPAKETDSRFADYRANFGSESWELDALDPKVLAKLVTDEFDLLVDAKLWRRSMKAEEKAREDLAEIARRYDEVSAFLRGKL